MKNRWVQLLVGVALVSSNLSAAVETVDLLGDGTSEVKITHGANGSIDLITIDAHKTGKPDIVIDYRKTPHIVSFYEKGQVVRTVTSSRTSSGQSHLVDTLIPLDPKLPITRTIYDSNTHSDTITIHFENDVQRNGHFSTEKPPLKLPKRLATSTAAWVGNVKPSIDASCTDPQQISDINQAIQQMMTQGLECLKKGNRDFALLWLLQIKLGRMQVACLPQKTEQGVPLCAEAVDAYSPLGALLQYGGVRLAVYPAYSTKVCSNFSLAEGLFHESLHYVLGPHENFTVQNGQVIYDPKDPVFACQHQCFGQPSPRNCAACFGAAANCNQLPPSPGCLHGYICNCGNDPLDTIICGIGANADAQSARFLANCPRGMGNFASGKCTPF